MNNTMLKMSEVEKAVQTLNDTGYVIIENLLSAETVANLNTIMDKTIKEKKIELCKSEFEGYKSIRIYNPLNLADSDPFVELSLNNLVLSIAENLLGEDLLLSSVTPIIRYPGEVGQVLHTDDGFFGFEKPHKTLGINALYVLTDFTKENGGTFVLPGSHKYGAEPTQDDISKCITAEVKAGGVLIYNAATWHGGGANMSQYPRKFCSFFYSIGCLRQEENLILSISEDKMRSFPNRLKQLCGYSAYRGLLGHVNRLDPITVLGEKAMTEMIWDIAVSEEGNFGSSSKREQRSVTGVA